MQKKQYTFSEFFILKIYRYLERSIFRIFYIKALFTKKNFFHSVQNLLENQDVTYCFHTLNSAGDIFIELSRVISCTAIILQSFTYLREVYPRIKVSCLLKHENSVRRTCERCSVQTCERARVQISFILSFIT